jgi:hypothetical protein
LEAPVDGMFFCQQYYGGALESLVLFFLSHFFVNTGRGCFAIELVLQWVTTLESLVFFFLPHFLSTQQADIVGRGCCAGNVACRHCFFSADS